ncbi:nucleotidyltransferase domain-containing protein, partial [Clostridium botulinum C/D]|nr:nucleotidyltransferase domain-containing protein [Clostridium botulinum C/D]
KKYTALLLEFMKEQEVPLSSEDILVNELFNNLNIRFERLLNRMLENGIIKRKNRNYKDEENNVLISENVYFI